MKQKTITRAEFVSILHEGDTVTNELTIRGDGFGITAEPCLAVVAPSHPEATEVLYNVAVGLGRIEDGAGDEYVDWFREAFIDRTSSGAVVYWPNIALIEDGAA